LQDKTIDFEFLMSSEEEEEEEEEEDKIASLRDSHLN
jgi:hypothetical protein